MGPGRPEHPAARDDDSGSASPADPAEVAALLDKLITATADLDDDLWPDAFTLLIRADVADSQRVAAALHEYDRRLRTAPRGGIRPRGSERQVVELLRAGTDWATTAREGSPRSRQILEQVAPAWRLLGPPSPAASPVVARLSWCALAGAVHQALLAAPDDGSVPLLQGRPDGALAGAVEHALDTDVMRETAVCPILSGRPLLEFWEQTVTLPPGEASSSLVQALFRRTTNPELQARGGPSTLGTAIIAANFPSRGHLDVTINDHVDAAARRFAQRHQTTDVGAVHEALAAAWDEVRRWETVMRPPPDMA